MQGSKSEVQRNITKAVASAIIYLGAAVLKELGKILICQSKDIEEKSKINIKEVEDAYKAAEDEASGDKRAI